MKCYSLALTPLRSPGISVRTCRKNQVSRDLQRKSKSTRMQHPWAFLRMGSWERSSCRVWPLVLEDVTEICPAVTTPPGLQKGVSAPAEIGYWRGGIRQALTL